MKRQVDRAALEAQISIIEEAGDVLSGFVQAMVIILLIALGTMFLQSCKTVGMGCDNGAKKSWQGRK